MRAYCIFIVFVSPQGEYEIVESAFDKSEFWAYQRSNIRQIFHNTGEQMAVDLTADLEHPPGEVGYMVNGPYQYYAQVDERRDYVSVVVASADYSHMAVRALLDLALRTLQGAPEIMANLQELLEQARNPTQFDDYMRIEQDLQETTDVVQGAVQGMVERGDQLELLTAQSQELSDGNKRFVRQVRIRTSRLWSAWYTVQDWALSCFQAKEPLKDHEKG